MITPEPKPTNYMGSLGDIDFLSHHNWASKAELETSATFWYSTGKLELGMIRVVGQEKDKRHVSESCPKLW